MYVIFLHSLSFTFKKKKQTFRQLSSNLLRERGEGGQVVGRGREREVDRGKGEERREVDRWREKEF